MAWMYLSNNAMFSDFDKNPDTVVERISAHYDMHPKFVTAYVEHLKESQRDNPRAWAGFESEVSSFQKIKAVLSDMATQCNFSLIGSRVLDIGCASGHAVRAMLSLGAKEAIGIEYNPSRAENGNAMLSTYGLPTSIIQGSILDESVTNELSQFDLVILFDVLEHVPSIEETIAIAARLLKKGGHIVIRAGNPYCIEFILREPHYGLPGLILLDHASAIRYHSAHFTGEYEVTEWMTRGEIENCLSAKGIAVKQTSDVPECDVSRFDELIGTLTNYEYPSEEIRNQILASAKMLKNMKRVSRDPEQVFGPINHMIVGQAV